MRRKQVQTKKETGGKREFFINLVIIFATAFFGISLIRNVAKVAKTKTEIADTTLRVQRLKEQNAEIKAKLDEVNSQTFVESQIRDKLGLAKPGEVVVVLPDIETLKRLAPDSVQDVPVLPEANWEKWYKLFF